MIASGCGTCAGPPVPARCHSRNSGGVGGVSEKVWEWEGAKRGAEKTFASQRRRGAAEGFASGENDKDDETKGWWRQK